MSNLKDIVIDGHAIETGKFCEDMYVKRIKVCQIINDFVAQGYGCLTLKPNEMKELTPGSHAMLTKSGGPKVCVGAGTGLGECFLTPNGRTGTYSCFPSEGGHVEFNPRSELEIKMRAYMMKIFGREHRLSVENVVSGPGLGNVYDFLVSEFPEMKDDKMHEEFLKAPGDSKGKFVSEHAKEGTLFHQAMTVAMA
jgi:glucokinase